MSLPPSPQPTALVTGATGFTGWYVAEALARKQYKVRTLVRDAAKAAPLAELGYEIAIGDLRDAAAVARATEGCSHVFHIGALYREAKFGDEVYHQVNAGGTANVLEAALRHGARVVHCSTVGVHGDVEGVAAEDAPFNPGDAYQTSKVESERLVAEYAARGLEVSCFRPAGIYGPRDTRFLKLFRTIRNRTFRMFGKGEIFYHLTFVEDLADGIVLLGEHPAAVGETFILTGPRYTTLNELVTSVARAVDVPPPRGRLPLPPLLAAAVLCETVCRPFGIEPPLHRRRCDFFTKSRAFSSEKARRLVGYAPKVELDEGLRRTAEWYFAQGMLA
ncbi:NAD-dependent epimerase/dehydratase family protein [Geminicoccaceae bacterium 1502E]|nr:NAD-dependent epimerase/dehydratase family protein [Geminicoccaceae bacterium 1502E]